MKKMTARICVLTLFCCAVMAIVDGVIQPGYVIKSAVKAAMFLLLPFLYACLDREILFRELFRLDKRGLRAALILGSTLYAAIIGAYFLLRDVFDFSNIAASLTENAGVTKDNFLYVALYISFANSLLEEFFFRGFIFGNLKQCSGRKLAYGYSAILFALYHVAMMVGWFSLWLYLLVIVGLAVGGIIFNYLNERFDTIFISWIVHMFANFAINTIGFLLLN